MSGWWGGVRAGCAEKCMCKGSEVEKNLAYLRNWKKLTLLDHGKWNKGTE